MTEQLPEVVIKRVLHGDAIVDCPFCGREHSHGNGIGLRDAHCGGGRQYVLVERRPGQRR